MEKTYNKKVFVIGIDGATLNLIEPWAREGKLPTFKKIMDQGSWGRLRSTMPPITPCAWSSFMTGKNPAQHGIFDFYYLNEKYDLEINSANKRTEPEIWDYLSNLGKKSIVLNIPFTYPPHKINGVMISGFTTPSIKSEFTYPSAFKQELFEKFPEYKVSENGRYSENRADQENYLNEIFSFTEQQYKTTKWLMEKEWDFFMVTFMGIDHIQHYYWKFMDKNHPAYTDAGDKQYGEKILNLYQKIDRIIGELLGKIPDQTNVIIMSDHGFGPAIKNIYINNWLYKKKYLFIKNNLSTLIKRILNFFNITPQTLVRLILKLRLGKYNQKVSFKSKRRLFDKISFTFKDIDWQKSKAYSLGGFASIFLNKSNPEVKKNQENIRKEIVKDLMTIKNPITKNTLVDKIWRKDDLYHGKYIDKMPDIIYSMDNFSYAASNMFGFASRKIFSPPITHRSGEHRLDGILFLLGPDLPSQKKLTNVKITDLAPTILNIIGAGIPQDMDGNIIK